MRTSSTTRRLGLAGAAALLATLGLGATQSASAQRYEGEVYRDYRDRYDYDRDRRHDRYGRYDRGWDWRGAYREELAPYAYGVPDHFDRDMAYYDRNRDGVLDRREQRAYFRHLADMGVFGRLDAHEVGLVARTASSFDLNNDGRFNGTERRGIRLFIVAMRRFERADIDGDNYLNPSEFRYASRSLPPPEYLDRDGDGFVSRRELRSAILQDFRQGRI